MKKIYMTPATDVLEYLTEEMIAGSVSSDLGIGYGGEDTEGTLDPSSTLEDIIGFSEFKF